MRRRHYDPINAVVCDLGSQSLRIGLASYYEPTVEIATSVGIPTAAIVASATAAFEAGVTRSDGRVNENNATRYDVDVTSLSVPREDVEMVSCMSNEMIDDWDLFEKIFDYAFANYIRSDPRRHPLLFTEPPLIRAAEREKLVELMFEKYNVPCIHLSADAVLAALASKGHHATAVVVDSGATHTTVVPVHDGYVISEAVLKSPVGGNLISAQCKQFFNVKGIDIVPRYVVGRKYPVRARETPIWTKKTTLPEVTDSWHDYMRDLVVQDFQQSVLELSAKPYDERIISYHSNVHYEFPNGYNQEFGIERFKIPESLFTFCPFANFPTSISDMVTNCINTFEKNVRRELYKNIIVVGGNSLLKGFSRRLSNEIVTWKPTEMQLSVVSPVRSIDRQFGAWVGGSIVATDERAEHLWFSSHEYNEFGKTYVHYKCPI